MAKNRHLRKALLTRLRLTKWHWFRDGEGHEISFVPFFFAALTFDPAHPPKHLRRLLGRSRSECAKFCAQLCYGPVPELFKFGFLAVEQVLSQRQDHS
jgi:hypothetical protein